MSKRIREPFGKAGLTVAVCALVMALVGGAYAADNLGDNATASAKNNRKGGGNVNRLIKREARKFSKVFSQRFSKRFPGPIGPQGVPGFPGAPGSDGSDGDDGSDGSDGSDGKTVLNGEGAPANSLGVDGDFYIDTDTSEIYGPKGDVTAGQWPPPTDLKGANGAEGQPWTPDNELPVGATLTGVIAYSGSQSDAIDFGFGENNVVIPISFPIPLGDFLSANGETHYVPGGDPVPPECDDATTPGDPGPDGEVAGDEHPEADSGHLCVFESDLVNIQPSPGFTGALGSPFAAVAGGGAGAGAGLTGSQLAMDIPSAGAAYATGTWAVTG